MARSAYGKLLHLLDNESGAKLPQDTELPFSGIATLFENIDEVRNAGKYPDDEKIIAYVNRDVINTARNKAQTAAFDAAGVVKPTIENDAELRLRDMIKLLKAANQSDEEAETNARIMLKMDAPEETDEE